MACKSEMDQKRDNRRRSSHRGAEEEVISLVLDKIESCAFY